MYKHSKKTLPATKNEILEQLESFRAFLYFHAYQPPRRLKVHNQVIYDITGESDVEGGYNERVYMRSYLPMSTPLTQDEVSDPDAILSSPLVAEHLFGITRDWIKHQHPLTWDFVKKTLQKSDIPFVDPYLHQILPLLPDQAKSIMIDIGIRAWEQDMDIKLINDKGQPLTGFGFWPPELSVDKRTVEMLRHKGVQFLVLDQEQIKSDHFSSVYELQTKHGSVYVFAYNGKEFARKLAFEKINNAKEFAKQVNKYNHDVGLPAFAAMDMETFGEWRGEESIWFLNYLVHEGLNPEDFKRYRDMIRPGELVEPSSWSCDCGFGRWDGSQVCCGESPELQKRKQDLYQGLRHEIEQVLNELNEAHPRWEKKFTNFFINTRDQLGAGENIDFSSLSNDYQKLFERLYVSLVGMTSCGWFYTDSELERNIPANSLEYLRNLQ